MFKHKILKQIKITCQLSSVKVNFVPLCSMKLTLGFIFADTIWFLLLLWFKVAANKNHTIFSGWVRDTGKLKKQGNFWLPRIRKECAPEFKMLADYVIRCNYCFTSILTKFPSSKDFQTSLYILISVKLGKMMCRYLHALTSYSQFNNFEVLEFHRRKSACIQVNQLNTSTFQMVTGKIYHLEALGILEFFEVHKVTSLLACIVRLDSNFAWYENLPLMCFVVAVSIWNNLRDLTWFLLRSQISLFINRFNDVLG